MGSEGMSVHKMAADLEEAMKGMTYQQWRRVRDLVDKSFEGRFREVRLDQDDEGDLFKRLSGTLTSGWL